MLQVTQYIQEKEARKQSRAAACVDIHLNGTSRRVGHWARAALALRPTRTRFRTRSWTTWSISGARCADSGDPTRGDSRSPTATVRSPRLACPFSVLHHARPLLHLAQGYAFSSPSSFRSRELTAIRAVQAAWSSGPAPSLPQHPIPQRPPRRPSTPLYAKHSLKAAAPTGSTRRTGMPSSGHS